MEKTITVAYNGSLLIVYKEVADRLGISQGHVIKTEQEFSKILNLNCTYGINLCNIKILNKN